MLHDVIEYAKKYAPIPVGGTLWLYGEPGSIAGDAYQPWHYPAMALREQGVHVYTQIDSIAQHYDVVCVHSPKQQMETEGLLAFAFERSRKFVMAMARGDAGGNRLQEMMSAYGVDTHVLSKSRYKIVFTCEPRKASPALSQQFRSQLAMRQVNIENEQWWSVPGIFGWDKIDEGSKFLIQHLPSDITGDVADFGCGYGYISVMLARRYPNVKIIDAYDADARAVACCAGNGTTKINAIWQDIRTFPAQRKYHYIIMNPPFHENKASDMALGISFVKKALDCLLSAGQLFFVANSYLPYEKALPALRLLKEANGYKILTMRVP